MDETELDKSEQATPHKLKRAREKGTVARGIDLGFFTALAAALGFAWLWGSQMGVALARSASAMFAAMPGHAASQGQLLVVAGQLFASASSWLLMLACTVFGMVLLFEILQTGATFSLTPIKPDLSRINPAKGLKRLTSWRVLVEGMKGVLKLVVYSVIGWLVIIVELEEGLGGLTDGVRLIDAMARAGFRLLLFCAIAAFFFAVVDQILSRRDFSRRMRMSRRELRREIRDREGDARIKQRRKQLHGEFSRIASSLRAARSADVIITNPTHLAIALRYDARQMAAPMVVSRGAGHLAERIRKIGFIYGVLVVQDAALARRLYRSCRLETEIPDALYGPVADLYRRHELTRPGTA